MLPRVRWERLPPNCRSGAAWTRARLHPRRRPGMELMLCPRGQLRMAAVQSQVPRVDSLYP